MSESISQISQPTPQQVQKLLVPSDLIPIPSNGKVYPIGSPLHNLETVAIRSMTARDEDILTSRALLKNGKAISTLLQNCLLEKSIDSDSMISGDRNAVLIGIRITGYGPEYKVNITCPGCGEKAEKEVDLASLPIKRFPEGVEPVNAGTNEFLYVLPVSKKKVTFRLLTGKDEQELLQILDRRRKSNVQDELVTTRLKFQTVSIDGETDAGKLANIISSLPAKDSRSLRTYMDKITPGVQLKTSFECASCDYVSEEVEVPLGTEFFWPTT